MGNSEGEPAKQSRQSKSSTTYNKSFKVKQEVMKIDRQNQLFTSYQHLKDNLFEKKVYNWKSIPIVTQLDITNKASFQVKNKGIKQNNFVVGIIKRSAIKMQISLPWKTHYCICYQSHEKSGESGVIYAGQFLSKSEKGIMLNDTIKVTISEEDVEFKLNKDIISRVKLPADFHNDELLPYVGLFNKGDKIEFVNETTFVVMDKK